MKPLRRPQPLPVRPGLCPACGRPWVASAATGWFSTCAACRETLFGAYQCKKSSRETT